MEPEEIRRDRKSFLSSDRCEGVLSLLSSALPTPFLRGWASRTWISGEGGVSYKGIYHGLMDINLENFFARDLEERESDDK